MSDKDKPTKKIREFLHNFFKELNEEVGSTKIKSDIVGVFSDEKNIYLVEEFEDGKKNLIPSDDGYSFDPDKKIKASKYKGKIELFKPVRLDEWDHPAQDVLDSRDDNFDHANLNILGEFETDGNIFILYDSSYITTGHQRLIGGGALISMKKPIEVIWRSENPLWNLFVHDDEIKYESLGVGGTLFKGSYYIYYLADNEVYAIKIKHPFEVKQNQKQKQQDMDVEIGVVKSVVKKHPANPILGPRPENEWESWTAMNPAVVQHDGLIHMFYRAQSHDHRSTVGYAVSKDGVNFDRLDFPVYSLGGEFDDVIKGNKPLYTKGVSGGGWGGCEDPKATIIGDTIYLIYVAFYGFHAEPRLGMTSIKIDDVINNRWENWSDPVFLTPWSNVFGTGVKSGTLFPEQIEGKYVFLYRYWPNILIDFVEDLDFGDGKKYLQERGAIKVRPGMWDSMKISAGSQPILTDEGWLLIYSGVGYGDSSKYKIGAMILDKNNPEKVLYRSDAPLLSPEEWYENDWKPGIMYPGGSIVRDGQLVIYYGGGDRVVCSATCEVDELIYDLKNDIVENDLLKSVYVHNQ